MRTQGDYLLVHCPHCGHLHGFHRSECQRVARRSPQACKSCGQLLAALAVEAFAQSPLKRRLLRFLLAKLIAIILLVAGYAWQLPSREQTLVMATNVRFRIDGAAENWRAIAPVYQSLDQLPEHVERLLTTSEDRRFYWHPGVDPIAIGRALWTGRGGGSTLTQQLARTLAGNDRSQSLWRKFKELVYAVKLESDFSKHEIVEMYLNNVWFGSGAYGIENASREYFGKHSNTLTALEAAILIRTLSQPSVNWHSNARRSKQRGEALLATMEQQFKPTDASQHRIKPGPLERREIDVASLLDSIRREGYPDCGDHQLIVTTINPTSQIYAEVAVRRGVAKYRSRGVTNAALISLGSSREIVAMVPTVDRRLSQYDHAMVARRPPGSAIKPLIYLAALQNGWTMDQTISAARYVDTTIGWAPRNYDDHYPERVTLREALAQSYNTAAVRLLQAVGPEKVRKLASELGFNYDYGVENELDMALGAGTTTLQELADLYAAIAAKGRAERSFLVWGAISQETWGVCHWRSGGQSIPADGSGHAYEAVLGAMRNVIQRGTGQLAQVGEELVYGKTGTSDEYRDAWFIGGIGAEVTAVWVGDDRNRQMVGVAGGTAPAEIFHQVLIQSADIRRAATSNREES